MLHCPYFLKNPLWIVLITASFALSSCASFFESVSAMTGQPGRSTPTTTTIPPTNVPVERPDAVRAAILTEAEKYIDVPYQSPSRAPTNFDCSAFVSYIYKRSAGLDLPASSSCPARRSFGLYLVAGRLEYKSCRHSLQKKRVRRTARIVLNTRCLHSHAKRDHQGKSEHNRCENH